MWLTAKIQKMSVLSRIVDRVIVGKELVLFILKVVEDTAQNAKCVMVPVLVLAQKGHYAMIFLLVTIQQYIV